MEVTIRLQRAGKPASKRYNFRIVAIPKAKARQADRLEILGHYDPSKKPAVVQIDQAKLKNWLDKGARMSDTVKSLVQQLKSKN